MLSPESYWKQVDRCKEESLELNKYSDSLLSLELKMSSLDLLMCDKADACIQRANSALPLLPAPAKSQPYGVVIIGQQSHFFKTPPFFAQFQA